jgi:hexokinase
MAMKERAQEFLEKHKLLADAIDVDAVINEFISEMDKGLAGEASSLKMIPTYVTVDKSVPVGKPVIVIDAGGTNLRAATITFAEGGDYTVDKFRKMPMPGTKEKIETADEFFGRLADFVAPLLDDSDLIGFCFSYPAEISPECDGMLIEWTKGIEAKDVEKKFVGKGLLDCLAKRGQGGKKIVVLNDTIATLLAGKSSGGSQDYDSYLGVIEGTGSNTAYVEQNANVGKLPDLNTGAMAINLESGGFAKCPRTDIDEAFDATTGDDAGKQKFEKMISGGYLGGVGLYAMKAAAAEGLLSSSAAGQVENWKKLETKDMDDFLWHPDKGVFTTKPFDNNDRAVVTCIAEAVIRRAAVLLAINVAAPIIKSGAGKSADKPVCVVMDGSTYYKTNSLKSQTEEFLRDILGERGIFFDTVQVQEKTVEYVTEDGKEKEDTVGAPMIGAAVAGLTV